MAAVLPTAMRCWLVTLHRSPSAILITNGIPSSIAFTKWFRVTVQFGRFFGAIQPNSAWRFFRNSQTHSGFAPRSLATSARDIYFTSLESENSEKSPIFRVPAKYPLATRIVIEAWPHISSHLHSCRDDPMLLAQTRLPSPVRRSHSMLLRASPRFYATPQSL